MSTRKTITRFAAIGGLCTAVARWPPPAAALGAQQPPQVTASQAVTVLVEAGGHAELTGVAETVQGRNRP